MSKYVALLRGIGPMNPNMRNEKLRGVFERLGFSNVSTVISSGNVVFESTSSDIAALESKIEAAWPSQLGFHSTTIIRSQQELERLVALQPFKGYSHDQATYLTVTFFKRAPHINVADLHWPEKSYKLLDFQDGALFSIVDLTAAKTPDLMARLEKEFGKEITTRTWKTVERILARMKQG